MEEQRILSRLGNGAAAGGTVLALAGNPALLQTLGAVFRDSPFNCVAAGDSLAALCAIVECRPFCVIVDMEAGPLAFWQFCALIRQHPEHGGLRLIASSARDDVVERARAAAAGADHFLPRPFTREDVLALLTNGKEGV